MTAAKRKPAAQPRSTTIKLNKPDKPRLAGRPPSYTVELGELICRRLANGESLRQICEEKDMPDRGTVFGWCEKDADFAAKYARAREMQADANADECQFIADTDPDPARARVRVGTRQWLAERMKPKKYGNKLELGGAGRDGAILVQFAEGDDKLM